jgi:3-methyladenine DNA glycosylase/8-oxoguanine DNA glycosylase
MRTSLERSAFLDLVVAMLAVNRWSLERTAALSAKLADEGFGNPSLVLSTDAEELAGRLEAAGYQRGTFMQTLLANRIVDAASKFDEGYLKQLEREHATQRIRAFLIRINGVGPEVVGNFLLLRS